MTSIERLLGEFADDWNAGRRPDIATYLARAAPADRDELARRLDSWLTIAATPDYDDTVQAQIAAEPLLVAAMDAAAAQRASLSEQLPGLRERAGLRIRDVAERLARLFALDDTARTADYLERLERDELDERRLSRRLISGLAAVLGADDLTLHQPAAPVAQAFFRSDLEATEWVSASLDVMSKLAFTEPPDKELDDLDRLFLGGPEG